ncbi:HIT domain-containing protein [Kineococcus sp. T13]|uniref:HIT family protein n=1 Tax=Kineococcus vitellinus TaxID=2696565 RepID=UPI0014132A77|nr:HIT family protein [Kineococcus vitellinus]NAZ77758.1 HIT domain-containing protein [Kineococcus vitellinus]
MTPTATAAAQECIFCAIARHEAEASVVHEDESVVAFMDRYPVTPGHLLVVPRRHAVGLEDLDKITGGQVWAVAHDLARTLRRSTFHPEGINLFLCDGEAAFQTVPHLHLHVIPRYTGDGWTVENLPKTLDRDRQRLDEDAQQIRAVSAHRTGGHPPGA